MLWGIEMGRKKKKQKSNLDLQVAILFI